MLDMHFRPHVVLKTSKNNFKKSNKIFFSGVTLKYGVCHIRIGYILKSDFIFGTRHFPPSFLWWKNNVYILLFEIIQKFKNLSHPYGTPCILLLIFYFYILLWHTRNELACSTKKKMADRCLSVEDFTWDLWCLWPRSSRYLLLRMNFVAVVVV